MDRRTFNKIIPIAMITPIQSLDVFCESTQRNYFEFLRSIDHYPVVLFCESDEWDYKLIFDIFDRFEGLPMGLPLALYQEKNAVDSPSDHFLKMVKHVCLTHAASLRGTKIVNEGNIAVQGRLELPSGKECWDSIRKYRNPTEFQKGFYGLHQS